jgi:hypothetical protein
MNDWDATFLYTIARKDHSKVRRMKAATSIASAVILIVLSPDASAYVGPGLGAGALAAVLGVVGGLLMLVVGVVWYPLKRVIRRLRDRKE